MNLTGLKNEFLDIVDRIESGVKAVWGEFCHIVYNVFKAEEQAIMAELTPLLKSIAVDLQNAKPGMDAKTFFAVLECEAVKALAGLGKTMAWTAISVTVGTVLHDLSVPDAAGNTGDLPGGVQTGG